MTYHLTVMLRRNSGRIARPYLSYAILDCENAANERHFYEGRYWTYNSLSALERLFPFWTRRQIERIIRDLKKAGVLLTGHYSKNSYDRTTFTPLTRAVYPFTKP